MKKEQEKRCAKYTYWISLQWLEIRAINSSNLHTSQVAYRPVIIGNIGSDWVLDCPIPVGIALLKYPSTLRSRAVCPLHLNIGYRLIVGQWGIFDGAALLDSLALPATNS